MPPTTLESIAAHLLGEPVAVVLAGDLPRTLRPRERTLAITGFTIACALRPWLGEQGRATDTPVVLLNDLSIRDTAGKLSEGESKLTERLFRQRILATLIHELAHVISLEPELICDQPEAFQAFQMATYQMWCAGDERVAKAPPNPWTNHMSPFICAAIHLSHRFELNYGERLPLILIADMRQYSLSPLITYSGALGDEPERLASVPLSELLTMAQPKAFTQLFLSDIEAYEPKPERKIA